MRGNESLGTEGKRVVNVVVNVNVGKGGGREVKYGK